MNTKILFFMPTGSPVGGVATWLDRACAALSYRGYDPVVGLVRGLKFNNPALFREYHPGLPAIEVDGRGLDSQGRILACLRTIRRVKPAVVFPLGVLDANDAAMRAKSRGADLRVVGRAQGNLSPMLADLEDYRDGLDHVVCVGALTQRYLVQHAGFDTARVDHIPNGANAPTTPGIPRQAESPLRLGYVGRLMKNDKRVLDIPPFCRMLAARGIPFHLTITGGGPCEQELRELLKEFASQITMTGPKKPEEVYSEILPNLDVLMLFSSSETFGIVLAEAMMNGVVPVTSRYVGFQSEQLVVEGVRGLSFPVGDVEKAVDAVCRLHDNSALLAQLAKASARYAAENCTWERCFDQWDKTLQRIIVRGMVQAPGALLKGRQRASGKLDQLAVPPAVSDALRRLRRRLLGVPVPPGGEEWPLFRRDHPAGRLEQIQKRCADLEADPARAREEA